MSHTICNFALGTFPQREIFAVVVYVGFFFFDILLVPLSALLIGNRILPDKAPRNTVLRMKDKLIVQFNRLITILFLYHMSQLSCHDSIYSGEDLLFNSSMSSSDKARAILKNLFIFCFAFFPGVIVFYDFFYSIFHRILHIEWLYPLIHKHHHLQYTPWRGNVDAINTHPIEYVLGEYNHLWSLFWVGKFCVKAFGYQPHASFILLYIVIAGLLSTLNHTRVDVRIPYIYNVWWHDLHHRNPPTNYGQYTMLWDWVFGWYKEESTKSAVNYNGGAYAGSDSSSTIKQQVVAAAAAIVTTQKPTTTTKGRGRSSSASKKKKDATTTPKKKRAASSSKSRSSSSSKKKK